MITTILAFWLAYAVHFTTIHRHTKASSNWNYLADATANHHLWLCIDLYIWESRNSNKTSGRPLFTIYGYNGLVIGYVLYTLPVAFILMQNSMQYIDKRFYLFQY